MYAGEDALLGMHRARSHVFFLCFFLKACFLETANQLKGLRQYRIYFFAYYHGQVRHACHTDVHRFGNKKEISKPQRPISMIAGDAKNGTAHHSKYHV